MIAQHQGPRCHLKGCAARSKKPSCSFFNDSAQQTEAEPCAVLRCVPLTCVVFMLASLVQGMTTQWIAQPCRLHRSHRRNWAHRLYWIHWLHRNNRLHRHNRRLRLHRLHWLQRLHRWGDPAAARAFLPCPIMACRTSLPMQCVVLPVQCDVLSKRCLLLAMRCTNLPMQCRLLPGACLTTMPKKAAA